MLDIGCGITVLYDYLPLDCDYTGIDVATGFFAFASAPQKDLIEWNFRELGFLGLKFDSIVDCLATKDVLVLPRDFSYDEYINSVAYDSLHKNGRYFFVGKNEDPISKVDERKWNYTVEDIRANGSPYRLTTLIRK